MPKRYIIPPETEKERFAIGLTMAQLAWAGGGLLLSFSGAMFWSWLTDSLFMSLIFGIPVGFVVIPFIIYRPKKKSMSYLQFLIYRWKIKHRQNELPNMRTNKVYKEQKRTGESDEVIGKPNVASVDITLGGGR